MSGLITTHRTPSEVPHLIPGWIEGLARNVGKEGFGSHLVSALSEAIGAQDCAAFRYGTGSAQTLLIGSVRNLENTRLAAQRYESQYWKRDRYLLSHQLPTAANEPAIYNIAAEQIGDKRFREDCYEFQDVAVQASIRIKSPNGVCSLSAFWGPSRRPGEQELKRFSATASSLMAFVERHAELSKPASLRTSRFLPLEEAEYLIRQLGTGLSEREVAVCSRIARGLTMQGIAADLGISFHSIVTYKRRAFSRLHIATTAELFSLLLPKVGVDRH